MAIAFFMIVTKTIIQDKLNLTPTPTSLNGRDQLSHRRTSSLKHGKRSKQGEKPSDTIIGAEEGTRMVKEALSHADFVRSGDSVSLAPSTTISPETAGLSATITACEPVSQGLVNASTRIVVVSQGSQNEHRAKATSRAALAEGDEDTSNEAFFTAAEDGFRSSKSAVTDGDTTSDETSASESDADLSDDFDDMISLSSPAVGAQTPGIMSALTAATPRPLGKQMNGINTPGSIYSSMTSTTLRGSQGRSKTFRAQGLLERIPDELLHPKPSNTSRH